VSVEPDVLVGIANSLQVSLEVLEAYDDRPAAVVGMEGKRLAARLWIVLVVQQPGIEEEMYVMLLVVDESEGRNAAGLEPQILHHAFRRSKRELAARGFPLRQESLLQPRFEVVDVEVVVAMEADEIVLVALMVAHEDVFAVDRAVVPPPTLGLLDGLALGMVVAGEGNIVFPEVVQYGILSLGSHNVGCLCVLQVPLFLCKSKEKR